MLFTVILSIYDLVINPTNTRVFRLKLPEDAQSGCTSQKIFLLIPWTKNLHWIYFLRAALNKTIYRKMKKIPIFGVFNKKYKFHHWISVHNQLKKQQFITYYSSLHFILLEMTISSPLKWEISSTAVTLLKPKFFLFWDPFWRHAQSTDLELNSSKYSFTYRMSYENKS